MDERYSIEEILNAVNELQKDKKIKDESTKSKKLDKTRNLNRCITHTI